MKGPNDSSFKEITGQYRMSTHGILAQYKTETSTGCTVNYYASTMNTFFTSELMMDLSNENGNTFGTSGNSLTDNFFASYTFILYPTNTNTYTISIEAIDGIKINVDGVTKLTNNVCGEYTGSFDLDLVANTPVMFFVQYRTNGVSHKLKLYWKSSDMTEKVLIPSSNMYREDYSRCFQSEVDSLTLPYTYLNNKYEIDCPSGYSGKSYYLCSNPNDKPFAYGMWSTEQRDTCYYNPISDVTYQYNALRLHRYESIRNILSYNGIATSINISPSLPNGLLFNENTGIISGSMSSLLSSTNYIVTVSNSKNSIEIIITIIVEETYCSGDNYPTTATGENAIGSCGDNTLYTGIKSATCGSIYPPIWTNIINTCIRNQCNSITTDSMVFETTNTNSYASITCPNNDGSIIRFCNKDMTWGDIENNCGKIVCIQEEYEGYIWPATEINTIRSIACGEGLEGNRKRSCNVSNNDSNQGEWSNIIDSSECMIAPVNIDISIPTSSHVMKEIPISFDFYGQNYHIDTNSILLNEGCSIESTINDISILPQYTILIRRSSECIITFNTGFLLNTENQILTPRSPFSTTLTIAYRPIPVLNESYNNHIGYATELGINKYVVDSRNTENEAIQLLTGGLSYEDKDINTPYSISTSPYSSIGDELSISLWFKIDSIGSKNILTKAGTNGNNYSIFINDNNELIISTGNEMDTCAYYNTNVILNIDTWTHIGFTMKTTSAYSGTKTIYINGESTTCTYSSMYISSQSPVILGETGGITVSDFKLYKYVLTNNEMIELYNTFAIPSIRITVPLTTTSNIIDIPIEFSESVKNININKVSIMNSIGGKDTIMSWTSTTLPSPSIHISFPISSGTRTLTTKLIFDTEFIQSTTTDIYNKYTEYIITYNSIIENPESSSFIPIFNPESSTSMSSNTPITFSFGQEVLFNGNSVIHYFDSEHSDEYNGDILISSLESSLTTLYIILPGGFALGRSIQFSMDSNICTALDGTPCPNVSSENTWIFTTNSPFTGTVVKSIEGNNKYASLIMYTITYPRQVATFDSSLISITNAVLSTVSINKNVVTFGIAPVFITEAEILESVDVSIELPSEVAEDYSIPAITSTSIISESFTAYSLVRDYSFKNTGNDEIANKNCIYQNTISSWTYDSSSTSNSAYTFTSTTPSWECENTEDITFSTPIINSGISISFWYKTSDNSQTFTFIKKMFADNDHLDYEIAPAVNQWHHIVYTLQATSTTNSNVSIYIDNNSGSFTMSQVRIYGVPINDAIVDNLYNQKSVPTISISSETTSISDSTPFTISVTTSKELTGIDNTIFSTVPMDAVTINLPTPIDATHFTYTITPLTLGTISLHVKAKVAFDSNKIYNSMSNTISITNILSVPISHNLRVFTIHSAIPVTSSIVSFTIDTSALGITIATSEISASYGTIKSSSVSGYVYTGIFKLADNTDISQPGVITLNRNICGDDGNSLCVFEIPFASFLTATENLRTVSDDGGKEKFDTEYYQQLRWNTGSKDFVITFEANCQNDALIGIREYPISTTSTYLTFVLGGGSNSGLTIRKTVDSTNTNLATGTQANWCTSGTYVPMWVKKVGTTVTLGKGTYSDGATAALSYASFPEFTYTSFVAVLDNWGNPVYYRNVRITSLNTDNDTRIPVPELTIDTSSSPYSATLKFTRVPTTELVSSSVQTVNMEVSEFTKVSNDEYTFKVSSVNTGINDNVHSITIPENSVSLQVGESTIGNSATTWSRESIPITVSLTWNPETASQYIYVPVTLTFNVPVTIYSSDIQVSDGYQVIDVYNTGNGCIATINAPITPITITIPEGLVTLGGTSSPAASLDIHRSETATIIPYINSNSNYPIWPATYAISNGELFFTLSLSSKEGIIIALSTAQSINDNSLIINFGKSTGTQTVISNGAGTVLSTITHDITIVSDNYQTYWVNYKNNVISIGTGIESTSESTLVSYEYNTIVATYFTFSTGESPAYIKNLSISSGSSSSIYTPLTITVSDTTSGTTDIPIVINVELPEGATLLPSQWIVGNGVMLSGTNNHEYLFYPNINGISTFFLPSGVVKTSTMTSAQSNVYSYIIPSRLTSYILPAVQENNYYNYISSGWKLPTTNFGSIKFNYMSTNDNNLKIAFSNSLETFNSNRYEITVCGNSKIVSIINDETVSTVLGTPVDCSTSAAYEILVDSTTIYLKSSTGTVYVSIPLDSSLDATYFTFAASTSITDEYLTSKDTVHTLYIHNLSVVYSTTFSSINDWPNDGYSSVVRTSFAAETVDGETVGTLSYLGSGNVEWGSRNNVIYFSHTLPTGWTELTFSMKFSSNPGSKQQGCIGLAKTSSLSWLADAICLERWDAGYSVKHQRKLSSWSYNVNAAFSGTYTNWVDFKFVKVSNTQYDYYFKQDTTAAHTSWTKFSSSPNSDMSGVDRLCIHGFDEDGSAVTRSAKTYFSHLVVSTVPITPYQQIKSTLGCMSMSSSLPIITIDNMSPEDCLVECASSEYYGLTQGNKCVCIPTYDDLTQHVDNSLCTTICAGDNLSYCGGSDNMYVIPTTNTLYYNEPFSATSGWKQDFPNPSIASVSYANGQMTITTTANTDITQTKRNNAPFMYKPMPKEFTSEVTIHFPTGTTNHAAGYAITSEDGQYPITLCLVDYYSINYPLRLVYKSYKTGGTYYTTIGGAVTDISIRLRRDAKNIFYCSYKYPGSGFWSSEYIDDTQTSAISTRLNLITKSVNMGKSSVYSDFKLYNNFSKTSSILTSAIKYNVNHNVVSVYAVFSQSVSLSIYSPFAVNNCVVSNVLALSDTVYLLTVSISSQNDFSIYLPDSIIDTYNHAIISSNSIIGSYTIKILNSWLIPESTGFYISTNEIIVYLVSSLPLSTASLSLLSITNADLINSEVINENTYKLSITAQSSDIVTIYLPEGILSYAEGVYNTKSNIVMYYYSPTHCNAGTSEGFEWPMTPIGTYSTFNCESDYNGIIKRYCKLNGLWDIVDNSSTGINTIRYANCPQYQSGSLYRQCTLIDNVTTWGELVNNCVDMPITSVTYPAISVHRYESIEVTPTIVGIAHTFESTVLPEGISINPTTGVISGSSAILLDIQDYAITVTNGAGSYETTVSIVINQLYCEDESYGSVIAGESKELPCENPIEYGNTSRTCLPQYPATWSEIVSTCELRSCSEDTDTIYNQTWETKTATEVIDIDYYDGGLDRCVLHRTCQVDGTWSEITSDCTRITCASTTVNDDTITLPETNVEMNYDLECPMYYSGNAYYTCTLVEGNGVWSDLILTNCTANPIEHYTYDIAYHSLYINSAIPMQSPVTTGIIDSYSITPDPITSGLTFDTETGVISGTATTIGTYIYTLTATNAAGSVEFTYELYIYDHYCEEVDGFAQTVPGEIATKPCDPILYTGDYTRTCLKSTIEFGPIINGCVKRIPYDISYSDSNNYSFYKGESVHLIPTVSGIVESISCSPALPGSLSIDTVGVIRGNAPETLDSTEYTVTFGNSEGSNTVILTLSVSTTTKEYTWKESIVSQDTTEWTQYNYDDSTWNTITFASNTHTETTVYYRTHFTIYDEEAMQYTFTINTIGGIEVYINGQSVFISTENKPFTIATYTFTLSTYDIIHTGTNTLAIRNELPESDMSTQLEYSIVPIYGNCDMNASNASSNLSTISNEPITNLFDGSKYTKACFFNGCPSVNSYIRYTYSAPTVITRYTLIAANDCGRRHPSDWTLIGSNDDFITETIVDRVYGNVFTHTYQSLSFVVDTPGAYRYCKGNLPRSCSVNEDGYGSANENGLSTKPCPSGTIGYIQSTCIDGYYTDEEYLCFPFADFEFNYSQNQLNIIKNIQFTLNPFTTSAIISFSPISTINAFLSRL
ncbi:hypothetical protein WA158_007393 [Blastocystis sp. Blastoise]